MSGSTSDIRLQKYYQIKLETPCISFAPNPTLKPGEHDNAEMDFHKNARNNFDRYLSSLTPVLDEFMESIVSEEDNQFKILEYSDKPELLCHWNRKELEKNGNKTCRVDLYGFSNGVNILSDVSITVKFLGIPEEQLLTNLKHKLSLFFIDYNSKLMPDSENDHF